MRTLFKATLAGVSALLISAAQAGAAEVRVMISGGFTPAYTALGPGFEAATGNKLVTIRGSSMGPPPNSIPARLAAGESADVVIMVGEALQVLIDQGRIVPDSRIDLAWSRIGMSVKAGAPKPDISTMDAFRRTLLNAKSIGHSQSASGVYISTQLFEKMGIPEAKAKAHPVGGAAAAARGEVELAFQQISELLPVEGADLVGPIPEEVQLISSYSAGIPVNSKNPEGALALIRYLASPAAMPTILNTGMEQPGPGARRPQ
jgi:molybdate transport system substrate-binding protein